MRQRDNERPVSRFIPSSQGDECQLIVIFPKYGENYENNESNITVNTVIDIVI